MSIEPKSILYAIHDLFKQRGVAPGGTIPFDILAKVWRETRLREPDLALGLKALENSGHVVQQRTHFGVEVRLVNDDFGKVVTDSDRKAAAALAHARKIRGPAPSYVAAAERMGTLRRRAAEKTDKPTKG
jgi:hypothetical protein